MQATYRVQWQNNTDGTWDNVDGIEYQTRRDAMRKLMEEVTNDPEYSHRIVKQTWEEDTIIRCDQGDD